MEEKERGFESLDFYQDSLKLLKASYKLAGNLPNYERYNLSDQSRTGKKRAIVAIARKLIGRIRAALKTGKPYQINPISLHTA